ncbi:VOC family protein [Flexivirga sp. ID2601S]|uniref:VOC family protein n=1 Tax=Flexivirga aerilata TaxID=1656889 RepID=A0A849AFI4_9MICO|nr:VOC family protein [Flexivirga aerilata]NNG38001.1 VOC family protein [Flexivirga aerilata]
MALEFQVTFDCADPAALAAFWAEATGGQLEAPPPGFESWEAALESWAVPPEEWNSRSAVVDPAGNGPRLFFQRVPEAKAAKNRVHLDLRAAPGTAGEARMTQLESVAARLVALGATRVRRQDPGAMDAGHIVMQDPEGNEFCLD